MRSWFHDRLRKVALADFDHNNLFEFNVMMVRRAHRFIPTVHPRPPPTPGTQEWLAWKPPARVCASFQGIFTHQEIDQ